MSSLGPTPDPLSLVGTTVSEKYLIERVVGEGGFAVVYRAQHLLWKRPVALKVFRTMGDLPAERRKELVEMFLQEGRLLADLSERSAAICQARDVGVMKTRDGREMPYMVLEWLEGKALDQVMEDEPRAGLPPRTPQQALMLLEPAAVALALAHRKGIAHRDVKPANIFILGEPRGELTVKLLDFGIAKVVQDIQRMGGAFAQTQGVVSSFTPAYGAPEQFSRTHGATGPWTDVFAIALIFTELVTQQPALRGEDLTQLAFCSMDPKRRPTPRTYGVDITDALEAVLRRALAVSPEERFQSMGELWDALRSALAMEPMRGFAGTDSSRSGSNPQVTALAPQSGSLPPLTPRLPTPPPFTPGSGAMNVQRTMPTVGEPPRPPPKTSNAAALFAGLGALVVVAGALVAGGVYVFAIRGKGAAAPLASASAPVVSASAPAPPPAPTCPSGMAQVPGGKFFMGSDEKDAAKDERPAHQVTLSPYCIDIHEVTVAEYKQCSDHGECKRGPRENEWPNIDAHERKIYDPLCNIRDPENRANHPINCVDWDLADSFCRAQKKRLPTEAEWEFATRGSDGRKYPWGDDAPTKGGRLNACGKECVAWAKKNQADGFEAMYPADDGFPTTAPVGSFPGGASPFGLQDVVGNVWEWVGDWYGPYTAAKESDPKGPDTGTDRVIRGGAWNGSDPTWVKPAFRFKSDPGLRSHGIGMRCAKDFR
ncbi:MAG TPA: bifunctional serine/threonine-protein kinase/formylglycine-generating enzyme family protein [Labilithrix sp.]